MLMTILGCCRIFYKIGRKTAGNSKINVLHFFNYKGKEIMTTSS